MGTSRALTSKFEYIANFARGEADIARRHDHVHSPDSTTTSTNTTDISTDTTNSDSTDSTDSTDNYNAFSNSGTMSGQATWFAPGLGACGGYNTGSDLIVAMSAADWNGGSNCNRQLLITDTKTGKTSPATVVDMCPGCGSGSLDMSPTLFQSLEGNLGDGVFPITWYFTS
ncbi:RlpA-like double-psi beta-barrel-protein domain-containing protein-containing protein [Thelephora terrestris]|uniref:RlpA-like double-psi beta-barrel-protein domain-containing protein-containing protein n=1 Tax=Thelephora terrestris TaxID=56493 RepID=A0A9P6HBM5_9AGAM|nr:RlpA-like double-psi beta-barrel-protein domain-containing protein-containing protein [Thelephora terrestris]